jgi:hypothetical protein
VTAVVVSSPGRDGAGAHWSHDAAAAIARDLAAAGHRVHWLAAVRVGEPLPDQPAAVERTVLAVRAAALHRVDRAHRHLALEVALTALLRAHPAAPVVHVGAGAGGSPNVAWLADRMGSPAFAVVRAAEVVCRRGDLVDATGAPCERFLDASRCARCCSRSPLQRARAAALLARSDLLAASLLACTAVLVPRASDVESLVAFGVPRRALVVGAAAEAVAARVLA